MNATINEFRSVCREMRDNVDDLSSRFSSPDDRVRASVALALNMLGSLSALVGVCVAITAIPSIAAGAAFVSVLKVAICASNLILFRDCRMTARTINAEYSFLSPRKFDFSETILLKHFVRFGSSFNQDFLKRNHIKFKV